MLVFAHAGITLGTAVLLGGLIGGRPDDETSERGEPSPETAAENRFAETSFASVGRRIDLRVLLVGSVIPDLDKPIGRLAFGTFDGQPFFHSLVFLLVIAAAGLCFHLTRHNNGLLVLGFGIFMHLVLDAIWLNTPVLLWPSQGFSVPAIERWARPMIGELLAAPSLYLFELIGVAILAYFAWLLAHRGNVYAFIRYGRV